MPAILIATSNTDPERPIQTNTEAKQIDRLLSRLFNKNYEVVLLPDAGTAEVTDRIMDLEDRLEIFHYCGHANPKALSLADQHAAADRLAERLKFCPNLKLVFLNGCETKEQAPFFQRAGAPYVIATGTKIPDTDAQWLAVQFYHYLALGNTVTDAFEKTMADAALQDWNFDLDIHRGVAGREEPDEKAPTIEWGLHILEGAEPYKLPLRPYTLQPVREVEHSKFIRSLILSLKGYTSPLNNAFADTIAAIEETGGVPDNTIFEDLMKVLPYPVGIRLRQIYARANRPDVEEAQYYRELLHDYACFFETLLHHSFAMLVSRLWDRQDRMDRARVAEEFQVVRDLICSNRLKDDLEQYAPAIKAAHHILGVSGIPSPLPHMAGVLEYFDSAEFREACGFFDLQKDFFRKKVRPDTEEAIRLCYESQQRLEQVFRHFGFIIQNVLASVRYINVINIRYLRDEAYSCEVWQLLASQDGAVRQKRLRRPMENKSVLCFDQQEINPDADSLNLFPFYLDRSAFTRQTSDVVDLYQFAGYFHDDWVAARSKKPVSRPCFYFISLSNPDRIWRFDGQDFAHASLAHIDEDETRDAQKRQSQLLTVAGELNNYLEQFKTFFNQ